MKIKEDIIKWLDKIREIKTQNESVIATQKDLNDKVDTLNSQVFELCNMTEQMAETMLALLRQQIGD